MLTEYLYNPTLFVVGWLIFSGVAAYIAHQRGRSPILFFFIAIILSPLVGIIAALMVRRGNGVESVDSVVDRHDHSDRQ